MNDPNTPLIAACGLDCTGCDIRRVPFEAEAAGRVVAWFKEEGWLKQDEGISEVIDRSMYCQGCRGSRAVHWTPDCWILKCCVDEQGLDDCGQCARFPCPRLADRAAGSSRYAKGWARLECMRASAGSA